jgi:transposase
MAHPNGNSVYQNPTGIPLAPDGIPPAPVAAGLDRPTSKEALLTKETFPNPEVQQRAQRRTFTRQYKENILQQAQNCTKHGQIGALLRREGLYSSHLTDWKRKQVQANQQAKKVGKAVKALPDSAALSVKAELPLAQQNRELRRKTVQLQRQLAQAQALLDLQKKVSQLLGITLANTKDDETHEAGS